MKNKNGFILCVLIFVFFASVFILFSSGHYGGDGLQNYLVAESIVLDKDIAIHDRPFGVKEMAYKSRGERDLQGRYYHVLSIGTPILLVPFYAVGHIMSKFITQIPHDYITQFLVSMFNPIITALTALVLFLFLKKLGFSLTVSFLSTLCYSFSTMSLIYARSGFSEPVVGLFVLLILFYMHKYETTGLLRYILISSLLGGCTVLIKQGCFLYLPLFFFYIVYKILFLKSSKLSVKLLLAFAIPIFLCLLIYLGYHSYIAARTLSKESEIIAYLAEEGFTYGQHIVTALFYYLISSGKGYFFYNLPLLLALFGIKGLYNKKKELSAYLLIFITINLAFYVYRYERGTLFSWGPRYLYPTIPIMCIFLAEFIKQAKSITKRILLAAFSLLGFMVQLPCLFISFTKYIFFVKEELGLQEYFINFIPQLSPIGGCWHLFISAIKREFTGVSLTFSFNPDYKFLEPIIKTLKGYDVWDIWWVNAINISPKLSPVIIIVVSLLVIISITSFAKIKTLISHRC